MREKNQKKLEAAVSFPRGPVPVTLFFRSFFQIHLCLSLSLSARETLARSDATRAEREEEGEGEEELVVIFIFISSSPPFFLASLLAPASALTFPKSASTLAVGLPCAQIPGETVRASESSRERDSGVERRWPAENM
jgi:hypothetical protein